MSLQSNISIASLPESRLALFLDIDGTLAPIASTPDMAKISSEVLELLQQLKTSLGGALALISGRNVENIDQLSAPFRFSAAGQHGLEIRCENLIQVHTNHQALIAHIKTQLQPLQEKHPKLLFEDKGLSIAVHYRSTPELEKTVKEYMQEAIQPYADQLQLQHGKMVCEIRLRGMDKGKAIDTLLQTEKFQGKLPIYIGDDLTDEDGFVTVNARGGISIKIGDGGTAAQYQLKNPGELETWLQQLQVNLNKQVN